MKKYITLLVFLFFSILIFSQNMRTEKYELFLLGMEENEVNISKGMYMTQNLQYYYEGTIEITYMNSGKTKIFNYFFSSWDNKYKEFLIKDRSNNTITPEIFFNDKVFAIIKNGSIKTKLEDNSSIENSILSSMIVWLDNQ